MTIAFTCNGAPAEVEDDGANLLEVLRDRLGIVSAKDGCSPQGQCGCCTVWVDGAPRVACVTPARRVAGREVTTIEGLPDDVRERWAGAFWATGGSQCGFCTPGIIMRLAALRPGQSVDDALLAHLCRCTGWQTIIEAAYLAGAGRSEFANVEREPALAARRAAVEGHAAQRAGAAVALGAGGFADDTAPRDALVAIPGRDLGATAAWVVAPTLTEARALARKVQGRRSTLAAGPPLELPSGTWDLTLRTSWVEPAYLEPDASWCGPDGSAASPLANGGAFGGKRASAAPAAAERLGREHGRPVRAVLAREDVVRWGPKRPPMAAGLLVPPAGEPTGVIHVVSTPGIAERIAISLPNVEVRSVDPPHPLPTSVDLRAAGWAEGAILAAAARWLQSGRPPSASYDVRVDAPWGASASARISPAATQPAAVQSRPDTTQPELVSVGVACGRPVDPIGLRSYCIGAVHMALSWVRSESLAVDPETGEPVDLTIRSFGILRARDMPHVEVAIVDQDTEPVNGSDVVFAAVAAAAWIAAGLPPDWPLSIETPGGTR